MIPKINLHVHLEGTITPTVVKALCQRNNLPVPHEIFGPHETFIWKDFLDFHSVYDKASACLRCPQDYADITYDYLTRCSQQGAIYVEMSVSPDHGALCGMSYQETVSGVVQGIEKAKKSCGIEANIIIVCVRHFGVKQCVEVAKAAIHHPNPYVVGFGMAGDEINYPPAQFAEAFTIAQEGGLQCTVHAGEAAGPESVWEAINYLPVKRLGHGVRSIEDPLLVKELVKRQIALEVCPGSNIRLKIYPDFNSHPFLQLQKAGLTLTIGDDDPPHFGTSIGEEYTNLQQYFGLTTDELLTISKDAVRVSFANEETKQRLLQRIEKN